MRDSSVGNGSYHVDYGCGVRALSGERTGYSYSESTDMDSLLKAAGAAALIASTDSPAGSKSYLISPQKATIPYTILTPWEDVQIASLVTGLENLDRMVRSADSRVSSVMATLSWSMSHICMYNSHGQLTSDSRPLASLSVSAVFIQNGQRQSTNISRSYSMGAEFFSEQLLREVSADVIRGIDERFEARRPKGGQMSVVMGAGASGILLHEAMGHSFEADHNRREESIFCNKMGQQICRKGINIVDSGTLMSMRGSSAYDDEGVPTQDTYMVQDGILTSYLHDRISARHYGVAPTGNGRRESFRYNPIPRMRCTYMENGSDGTLEDLIKEAGNGIYVDNFANGQVNIGKGDFTFYVKSGFLIEGGSLTMPIKDINIIGNGPQALGAIRAVASDLVVDPGAWTCGKGQSVNVSCGIPSVLVDGLTVGGE